MLGGSLLFLPGSIPALDSAYHSNAEIGALLQEWAETYSDYLALDTIGQTDYGERPIVLARISSQPREVANRPAILFIGQVHAEEILGVELTLRLMQLLLETAGTDSGRARLEAVDLYFVPTANPDGLEIVHTERDVSFRKNCRDNIGDGVLRIASGIGRDTSGVDLNRNFGLHWERGDSLYQTREGIETFNYYRGPGAFSEPETRALRDLMLQRRFFAVISYHSSRSGQNAEMVIAPWNWEGRLPPDYRLLDALGRALAEMLPRENGGPYASVRATQRNGQLPDWAYQATGALAYMIEIGASIQPDSAGMERVVTASLPSAFYLIDLAAGRTSLEGYGILKIATVHDGSPVEAEVQIGGLRQPGLEPRLTHPATGRIDCFLPEGSHVARILAEGFRSLRTDTMTITSGQISTVEISLERFPAAEREFITADGDSLVESYLQVRPFDRGPTHRFTIVNGRRRIRLTESAYEFALTASGYLPQTGVIQISPDVDTYRLPLHPAEVAYTEDFNQMQDWQRGGAGEQWGIEEVDSRTVLTESTGGPYPVASTPWLLIEPGVLPDSGHAATIELVHRIYFEPDRDFALVEVFRWETREWRAVASYTGYPAGWDTSFIALDPSLIGGGPLQIRLKVISDEAVAEEGWAIDRITVHLSNRPLRVPVDAPPPPEFSLRAWPVPANGSLVVSLQGRIGAPIDLNIYDRQGRRMASVASGTLLAERHVWQIDVSHWPSGTYYVQSRSGSRRAARSVVVLK